MVSASFYPKNDIFCVGNPRKVSNLTAVSAWNLPPLGQKSAWKSSCQQTLGCQTAKGYLKIDFLALPKLGKNDMLFINREMGFQQLVKFQVAFLLPVLFTFAPHAGAEALV